MSEKIWSMEHIPGIGESPGEPQWRERRVGEGSVEGSVEPESRRCAPRRQKPSGRKGRPKAPKRPPIPEELSRFAALDVREIGRLNAELWGHHTERSKQLVLEAAALTGKQERCVVVGAGPCYDIPLAELAEIFQRVELLDLNPGSLELAVSQLPEDLAAKVECRVVELTHALSRVLGTIKQEFIKSGTRGDRARSKAIHSLLRQPVGAGELAQVRGDLVVSDMILSQLPTALWLIDEWYVERYGESLMSDPGWVEAMGAFKQELQLAHLQALRAQRGSVVALLTDFGVAESEAEATIECLAMTDSITLALPVLQEIGGLQAEIEKTWIWHRDASKYSPVWGLAFLPE